MGAICPLNRFNKGVCWFTIIFSSAAVAGIVWFGGRLIHALLVGSHPDKELVAVFAVILSLILGVTFVVAIVLSKKILRYAVEVTEDGIRTPDNILRWRDIQSMEHPTRTYGLAFQISTRDGRKIAVYPVEGARELEAQVTDTLSRRTESEEPGSLVEYAISERWRKSLVISLLILSCAMAAVGLAFLISVSRDTRSSGSGMITFVAFFAAMCILKCTIDLVRSALSAKAVVFGDGIRVGNEAARWDEIEWIEHSTLPWVAFRISRRRGLGMNVFSGLANLEELRAAVEARLAGA